MSSELKIKIKKDCGSSRGATNKKWYLIINYVLWVEQKKERKKTLKNVNLWCFFVVVAVLCCKITSNLSDFQSSSSKSIETIWIN